MDIKLLKSALSKKVLDKKILFIGLDGASKRIIDKMVKQKKLPTIQKLINTGSYFRSSHSFKPCASPVIWTSIATGKKPEKHGIKGFYDNTYSLTAKRIWEIFDSMGFPIGVMGHLVTWPPKKVNGFMIPSILALDKLCYPEKYGFMWEMTHDAENKKKVSPGIMLKYFLECNRNGIKLTTILQTWAGFIKRKIPLLNRRDKLFSMSGISFRTKFYRDLFIHLYKIFKPEYAYFHIHLLDTYSHEYWKFMEPELYKNVAKAEIRRYKHKIYDAYSNSERIIQNIIDNVDSDTLVIIASDHGFRGINKTQHWVDNMAIKVQKFVDLDVRGDLYISNIIPSIHVLIRDVTIEKNEYYKTFLNSIEVFEDKKPLFNIEEVGFGNFNLEFNRDIDEISGKHILINKESYLAGELLMAAEDYTSGIHDNEDGILILNGPDIKQNVQQRDPVTVYDIIPTILALCNLPIGRDMDGKVITEAIERDFLNKYPVQYIDTYEDIKIQCDKNAKKDLSDSEALILKNQLRNLGYF